MPFVPSHTVWANVIRCTWTRGTVSFTGRLMSYDNRQIKKRGKKNLGFQFFPRKLWRTKKCYIIINVRRVAFRAKSKNMARSPSLSVLADCFCAATKVIPLRDHKYAAQPYDCAYTQQKTIDTFLYHRQQLILNKTDTP